MYADRKQSETLSFKMICENVYGDSLVTPYYGVKIGSSQWMPVEDVVRQAVIKCPELVEKVQKELKI